MIAAGHLKRSTSVWQMKQRKSSIQINPNSPVAFECNIATWLYGPCMIRHLPSPKLKMEYLIAELSLGMPKSAKHHLPATVILPSLSTMATSMKLFTWRLHYTNCFLKQYK